MEKAICCFGHREIFRDIESAEEIIEFKKCIKLTIEQQIVSYGAEIFMTGRRGEFDNVFACAVRELKHKYPHINLLLIEPYFSNSLNRYKEYYETMYDSIIIPDELTNVHYKSAIALRNRWMVERCYFVFTYVNRRRGGAYKAAKYAAELNKFVLNYGI